MARLRLIPLIVGTLFLVAAWTMLAAGARAGSAGKPNTFSDPSWLPLRSGANGTPFKVTCVKTNCPGPYHNYWAIDFVDPDNLPGAPVYAAGAGKVTVAVGSNSTCGPQGTPSNRVEIDHNGTASVYLHLSKLSVKKNDWVDENDQIGTLGSVGWTEPCPTNHLHFEVKKGGVRVEPPALKACQGGNLVTFPAATGASNWDAVKSETAGFWSDGTSCVAAPPSGGPGNTNITGKGPEWVPLKGAYKNGIGCTWGNGCSSGTHATPAVDFT